MNMPSRLTFYGDSTRRNKQPHRAAPSEPEPYKASPALIKAVNLAIYLERPLLLEGEAGCGKTRLAHAVAYELGLPLYRWDVRSTSKAKDGLYSYDAMLRLHDVEIRKSGVKLQRDPADPTQYRTFGALGQAFQVKECRAVVLIDEIDKADIDFPNDLLAVLDDPWAFDIPETGETITAAHKPIVIVTSNKEKGNLPAPFLRRCLYHFVEFPNDTQLQEIVELHHQEKKTQPPSKDLVKAAIARFQSLRKEGGLHKLPGTSEFLDWIAALQHFEPTPYTPKQLADASVDVPYPEVLFKLRPDWQHRHVAVKAT
jgi:MoxR-like ATPase